MKKNILISRLSTDYIRITVNGNFSDKNRFTFGSGVKAKTREWNDRTKRIRHGVKDSKSKNERLDLIENKLKELLSDYTNKGIQPSTKVLKKQLKQKLGEAKNPNQIYFSEYFEQWIEREKKIAKGYDGKSKNTLRNYDLTRRTLKDFEDKKGIELQFQDIDIDFFYDFIEYLETYTKAKSPNTRFLYFTQIKKILNDSFKQGLHKNQKHKDFEYSSVDVDNIYLTDFEILKIYQLDLTGKSQKLTQARDLFIVGCLTGLRFSDYTKISENNFKQTNDGWIYQTMTQKKKNRVSIPCNPAVIKIMMKNDFQLKTSSHKVFIGHIRLLGKLAGITEETTIESYKGKIIKPKNEFITTHTARRSFATNCYLAGIDTMTIRAFTGHKTESSFMKYIKVTKEQIATKMLKNKRFSEEFGINKND